MVTCLVTDAKLTADPGVASSIPARSHTFVEIDHEIISTVILLPSAESFMKGCCQLQAKVCARLLVNCLFKLAQVKSVVRRTDRPAMTIAVDMGCKATKANKQTNTRELYNKANLCPKMLNTVNSEIFARVLFSRITFKDMFAMLPTPVLLDFSLTVNAATLIFISGRGLAITSFK